MKVYLASWLIIIACACDRSDTANVLTRPQTNYRPQNSPQVPINSGNNMRMQGGERLIQNPGSALASLHRQRKLSNFKGTGYYKAPSQVPFQGFHKVAPLGSEPMIRTISKNNKWNFIFVKYEWSINYLWKLRILVSQLPKCSERGSGLTSV